MRILAGEMRHFEVVLAALLLAACSNERKLEAACEKGDPAACDTLSTRYAERAAGLCQDASPELSASCSRHAVKAVPLDLPKAARSGEVEMVFSVVLVADGTTQVDGQVVPSDDAILPIARSAHEKNPDLRAVIKADSSVPHGRVIHVLDELKIAGVSKIAFGVSPLPAGPPVTPTPSR